TFKHALSLESRDEESNENLTTPDEGTRDGLANRYSSLTYLHIGPPSSFFQIALSRLSFSIVIFGLVSLTLVIFRSRIANSTSGKRLVFSTLKTIWIGRCSIGMWTRWKSRSCFSSHGNS